MRAARGAAAARRMEGLSPADYLDDPLTAHPRYRKIRDLNEGTFGVVVLAQDVRIKEPVRRASSSALPDICAPAQRGGPLVSSRVPLREAKHCHAAVREAKHPRDLRGLGQAPLGTAAST